MDSFLKGKFSHFVSNCRNEFVVWTAQFIINTMINSFALHPAWSFRFNNSVIFLDLPRRFVEFSLKPVSYHGQRKSSNLGSSGLLEKAFVTQKS